MGEPIFWRRPQAFGGKLGEPLILEISAVLATIGRSEQVPGFRIHPPVPQSPARQRFHVENIHARRTFGAELRDRIARRWNGSMVNEETIHDHHQ